MLKKLKFILKVIFISLFVLVEKTFADTQLKFIIQASEIVFDQVAIDNNVKTVKFPSTNIDLTIGDSMNAKFPPELNSANLLSGTTFDNPLDKLNWFDVYNGCKFSFLTDIKILGFTPDQNHMFLRVRNKDQFQDAGEIASNIVGDIIPGSGDAINLVSSFLFTDRCENNREYTIVIDLQKSVEAAQNYFKSQWFDLKFQKRFLADELANLKDPTYRPKLNALNLKARKAALKRNYEEAVKKIFKDLRSIQLFEDYAKSNDLDESQFLN